MSKVFITISQEELKVLIEQAAGQITKEIFKQHHHATQKTSSKAAASATTPVDKMTLSQLKTFIEENGVELKSAKGKVHRKPELVAAIREWKAKKFEPPQPKDGSAEEVDSSEEDEKSQVASSTSEKKTEKKKISEEDEKPQAASSTSEKKKISKTTLGRTKVADLMEIINENGVKLMKPSKGKIYRKPELIAAIVKWQDNQQVDEADSIPSDDEIEIEESSSEDESSSEEKVRLQVKWNKSKGAFFGSGDLAFDGKGHVIGKWNEKKSAVVPLTRKESLSFSTGKDKKHLYHVEVLKRKPFQVLETNELKGVLSTLKKASRQTKDGDVFVPADDDEEDVGEESANEDEKIYNAGTDGDTASSTDEEIQSTLPVSSVTKEQFATYYEVMKIPIDQTDVQAVCDHTGLHKNVVSYIQANYTDLRTKYPKVAAAVAASSRSGKEQKRTPLK